MQKPKKFLNELINADKNISQFLFEWHEFDTCCIPYEINWKNEVGEWLQNVVLSNVQNFVANLMIRLSVTKIYQKIRTKKF